MLSVDLCGVVEGSLPIGGLSSSAAVILTFLDALCQVNGIRLDPQELIQIAFDAKKNYVGVNVGTLDQSCEVLSRKDHLLYLDCKDNSYELIPTSPAMKPYAIAIFFSGLEHSLVRSKYNMRVDELRSGVLPCRPSRGWNTGNSTRQTRGMCRLKSIRNTRTGFRNPGSFAANTDIPNSSGWKRRGSLVAGRTGGVRSAEL